MIARLAALAAASALFGAAGAVRERGKRIPLHAATLWLHHNVPGTRQPSRQAPYPLILEEALFFSPTTKFGIPYTCTDSPAMLPPRSLISIVAAT